MFQKILIANRGEIARRVLRTCARLNVATVAVYSIPDREGLYVREAGESIALGGNTAAESYLRGDAILNACLQTGAQAVHPGYGFLSENADFADACERAGVVFIGPTPEQMRQFGLKHTARALAREAGVPLLPGSALLETLEQAESEARRVGFPVMLKSTAGGGGIGMRLCRNADELVRAYENVRELGRNNFKNDGVYVERFVERARHIEVQIFGDGLGRVLALGERDCSIQRRNQKVIEETPAPRLSDALRAELQGAAVRLAERVRYRNAGTVEFVYDDERQEFYFLEVNTRLQVEHGVTESVLGIDLVEWMIRLANGDTGVLPLAAPVPRGHAIQARVYAEDPVRNFQPSAGKLEFVVFPEPAVARVDTDVESGSEISPYYDPLLAKVIVNGADRASALARLKTALAATRIYGVTTNIEYLCQIIEDARFCEGAVYTKLLESLPYRAGTIEVVTPGAQSSVQDFPGRLGYWDVGVPPSGPFDALSFRLGNRLLENPGGAAGLELTVHGPTLRFHGAARICLTGARMRATLDGEVVPYWTTVDVQAGQLLKIGAMEPGAAGQRSYLLFAGGLDVPEYLGSKSTFLLGQFGGHAGRALAAGDTLRVLPHAQADTPGRDRAPAAAIRVPVVRRLPDALIPQLSDGWTINVLYGPHAAPDFFTEEYIRTFFETEWQVHYNSARTGVRLLGPKPGWARPDGGEAGLHPSNIHDNAYAVGSIDFTGDMPIILGPDGPSLGGFVCPATVISSELWKVGQLRPGDRVRFVRVSPDAATTLVREQERTIEHLAAPVRSAPAAHSAASDAILFSLTADEHPTGMSVRQAGDRNVLVEYGPMALDLRLRCRVHALMTRLQSERVPGILDLTPGIRSLQIHFDGIRLNSSKIVDMLRVLEPELPDPDHMELQTRVLYLPLSWDDPSTRLAIDKYMQSVWQEAPWCPSNLEFIRRINGLESIAEVQRIVFDASYLVLGLGDVYLGAPVATPLDPRHRLVTTKYNPARTWTPQNAVGIGGAYLCIYGMEGPGGYQFIGRTCQVWNTYRSTAPFEKGHPYLLRFFDQIRWYPVSPEELADIRADFLTGRHTLRIEAETFRMREYEAWLAQERESIEVFQRCQRLAFAEERERWTQIPAPQVESGDDAIATADTDIPGLGASAEVVLSPLHASVWKIPVAQGVRVTLGQELIVLEAMKMEVSVQSPADGVVTRVLVEAGRAVRPGQALVVVEPV